MSIESEMKKIYVDVNDLDAKYLTQWPMKMSHAVYVKKRDKLRNKFESLKKKLARRK